MTNMADESIFAEPTPPANESFLEKYVGEGKKFKTEEELAKAYEHADKFIPELKNDLQETREFIAKQLEELAKRNAATPTEPTVEPRASEPAPVVPPKEEGEDLDTRIKKALEEEREVSKLRDNGDYVEKTLTEHFGSTEEAAKAVAAKALEMGVSRQFLQDASLQSPQAFFKLMEIDPATKPTSSSTPAPSADVRPEMLGHGKPKPNTYEFYEQLRQSNPKLYWTQKTQTALMRDAMENPNFFNR